MENYLSLVGFESSESNWMLLQVGISMRFIKSCETNVQMNAICVEMHFDSFEIENMV